MRLFNNLESKTPSDTWKSSAGMCANSGSQLFRTTTGIHSGPNTFDDSRLVMTFLPIFGVYIYIYIYINSNLNLFTKCTRKFRDPKLTKFHIFPWNISQMIIKTVPISKRIVISYTIKRGISFWVYPNFNGSWDNNLSHFPNGAKSFVEQILMSEDRNKSKRIVRVTVRDPCCKINHLRKVYNKTHQVYQFHQNRLASLYGEC